VYSKTTDGKLIICNGITSNNTNCTTYARNNTNYCKPHNYFVNLTEDQINKIKAGDCKKCRNCNKFNFDSTSNCTICLEKKGKSNIKIEKKAEIKIEVNKEQIIKDNTENLINSEQQNIKICKGNLQKNKPCEFKALENDDHCGFHSEYAKLVKTAQETNTKLCTNPKHNKDCIHFISKDSKFATCQNCKEKNNQSDKNKRTAKLENNNKIINDVNITEKIINCLDCTKTFKYGDTITANKSFSMKCPTCFNKQQKTELNRKPKK
jgi:hypothetical protein